MQHCKEFIDLHSNKWLDYKLLTNALYIIVEDNLHSNKWLDYKQNEPKNERY